MTLTTQQVGPPGLREEIGSLSNRFPEFWIEISEPRFDMSNRGRQIHDTTSNLIYPIFFL